VTSPTEIQRGVLDLSEGAGAGEKEEGEATSRRQTAASSSSFPQRPDPAAGFHLVFLSPVSSGADLRQYSLRGGAGGLALPTEDLQAHAGANDCE
jgi:hypothetical protein